MQISYDKKDAGTGIGYGLFVNEFVPVGTLVWKYSLGVNVTSFDAEAAATRLSEFHGLQEAQLWLDMTYG